MAFDFLTLSMTEKQPGAESFNVIAIEVSSYQLHPIRLGKNEIISEDGKIIWDIGRITTAETAYLDSEHVSDPRNAECLVTNCSLSDQKVKLKRILDDNITPISQFIDYPDIRFAIVKASDVLDIILEKSDEDPRPKCRLQVSFGNSSYTLLNKDYRWVNYWVWQYAQNDEERLEENKRRYLQLLNRRGKSLYLILYRHYYQTHPAVWIAGMHWL